MSTVGFNDILVHVPIVYNIIKWCSPIAYINWRCAQSLFIRHPNKYPSVLRHFKVCLQHALKFHLDQDYILIDKLNSYMQKYEAFITGGFLLAVLNGDTIEKCQDIDIVIEIKSMGPSFASAIGYTYNHFNNSFHSFQSSVPSSLMEYLPNVNVWTGSAIKSRVSIQFISTWFSTGCIGMVDNFDFVFCKNIASLDKLRIWDVSSVTDRQCTITPNNFLHAKYGQYIIGNRAKSVADACIQRIYKYKARNYTITVPIEYVQEDARFYFARIIRNATLRYDYNKDPEIDAWTTAWTEYDASTTKRQRITE